MSLQRNGLPWIFSWDALLHLYYRLPSTLNSPSTAVRLDNTWSHYLLIFWKGIQPPPMGFIGVCLTAVKNEIVSRPVTSSMERRGFILRFSCRWNTRDLHILRHSRVSTPTWLFPCSLWEPEQFTFSFVLFVYMTTVSLNTIAASITKIECIENKCPN